MNDFSRLCWSDLIPYPTDLIPYPNRLYWSDLIPLV